MHSFFSILENSQFGGVSGCCYGYCDELCDWRIKLSALNMIGCCSWPISANCPISLSDYNHTQ